MRTIDPHGPAARRWAVAGLGLVLAATVAVAATYTPLFAAGDIRLDAPDGMTRAEILAVARVTDRSNVFHLDTAAVERRLERDPRILRATVTTSLPDRITIEVVPRTAVASPRWGRGARRRRRRGDRQRGIDARPPELMPRREVPRADRSRRGGGHGRRPRPCAARRERRRDRRGRRHRSGPAREPVSPRRSAMRAELDAKAVFPGGPAGMDAGGGCHDRVGRRERSRGVPPRSSNAARSVRSLNSPDPRLSRESADEVPHRPSALLDGPAISK